MVITFQKTKPWRKDLELRALEIQVIEAIKPYQEQANTFCFLVIKNTIHFFFSPSLIVFVVVVVIVVNSANKYRAPNMCTVFTLCGLIDGELYDLPI